MKLFHQKIQKKMKFNYKINLELSNNNKNEIKNNKHSKFSSLFEKT